MGGLMIYAVTHLSIYGDYWLVCGGLLNDVEQRLRVSMYHVSHVLNGLDFHVVSLY